MNARDFCFWLHGYFEIAGEKTVSKEQVEVIKENLKQALASAPSLTTVGYGNVQFTNQTNTAHHPMGDNLPHVFTGVQGTAGNT